MERERNAEEEKRKIRPMRQLPSVTGERKDDDKKKRQRPERGKVAGGEAEGFSYCEGGAGEKIGDGEVGATEGVGIRADVFVVKADEMEDEFQGEVPFMRNGIINFSISHFYVFLF